MSVSRLFLLLAAFGAYPFAEGNAPASSASAPSDDQPTSLDQPAAQDSPSLRWISRKADGKDATVEVIGIDRETLSALEKQPELTRERWMSCLAVRVLPALPSATTTDTPPLLGSYRVEGDVIRFVPRFPLEPGLRYRAEFDPRDCSRSRQLTAKGPILGLPHAAAHHASRPNSRLPGDLPPRPRRSLRSTPRARGFRRICSGSISTSPPR